MGTREIGRSHYEVWTLLHCSLRDPQMTMASAVKFSCLATWTGSVEPTGWSGHCNNRSGAARWLGGVNSWCPSGRLYRHKLIILIFGNACRAEMQHNALLYCGFQTQAELKLAGCYYWTGQCSFLESENYKQRRYNIPYSVLK